MSNKNSSTLEKSKYSNNLKTKLFLQNSRTAILIVGESDFKITWYNALIMWFVFKM